MKRGAWALNLIMTRRFDPDRATMRLKDTTSNRKAQPRTAALEFCLAARMEAYAPKLSEFVENNCLIFRRNSNSGIRNRNLDKARQPSARDRNVALIRRVLDRVVDHISKRLCD